MDIEDLVDIPFGDSSEEAGWPVYLLVFGSLVLVAVVAWVLA